MDSAHPTTIAELRSIRDTAANALNLAQGYGSSIRCGEMQTVLIYKELHESVADRLALKAR